MNTKNIQQIPKIIVSSLSKIIYTIDLLMAKVAIKHRFIIYRTIFCVYSNVYLITILSLKRFFLFLADYNIVACGRNFNNLKSMYLETLMKDID